MNLNFIIAPLNADGSWTFKSLAPPRVGDVAPLDIFFKVGATLGSSGNAKITVQIGSNDHLENTGKWNLLTTPTYVCYLKKLADSTDVPCKASLAVSSSSGTFTALIYGTITAVNLLTFTIFL